MLAPVGEDINHVRVLVLVLKLVVKIRWVFDKLKLVLEDHRENRPRLSSD